MFLQKNAHQGPCFFILFNPPFRGNQRAWQKTVQCLCQGVNDTAELEVGPNEFEVWKKMA